MPDISNVSRGTLKKVWFYLFNNNTECYILIIK